MSNNAIAIWSMVITMDPMGQTDKWEDLVVSIDECNYNLQLQSNHIFQDAQRLGTQLALFSSQQGCCRAWFHRAFFREFGVWFGQCSRIFGTHSLTLLMSGVARGIESFRYLLIEFLPILFSFCCKVDLVFDLFQQDGGSPSSFFDSFLVPPELFVSCCPAFQFLYSLGQFFVSFGSLLFDSISFV